MASVRIEAQTKEEAEQIATDSVDQQITILAGDKVIYKGRCTQVAVDRGLPGMSGQPTVLLGLADGAFGPKEGE